MSIPIKTQASLTSEGGQTSIGGLNHVFHCNHYNAHLQMVVRMSKGIFNHDPEKLLTNAITPLIHLQKQNGYSNQDLIDEFSFCGFGILQQQDDKTWITPSSHYGQSIYSHDKPHKSCFFTSGFIQGLVDKTVVETECQRMGAHEDKFEISDDKLQLDNYLIHDFPLNTAIPNRFEFDECQDFSTDVDENKIIDVVKTLPLYGQKEDTGLIDAFGVVLTNHFADYYNRISYETYDALRQAGIPDEDSMEMFVQSGHICAFNTFGGIMGSPEWHSLVAPMCQTREDWFHGMVAVINALGWGIFRIEKIDIEKEFVLRVYNSYEGVGYRRMYPVAQEKELSFLGMGATLGLVHLLWKVDIRERPTLDQTFYVNQFNNPENSYYVHQTHAIAAGDDYDRFVVAK